MNSIKINKILLYVGVTLMIAFGILVFLYSIFAISFKFLDISLIPFSILLGTDYLENGFFNRFYSFVIKQPSFIGIIFLISIPLAYKSLE